MRRNVSQYLSAGLLTVSALSIAQAQNTSPKVSWHWHMHQPIYWNDQSRVSSTDRYENVVESIQMKNGGNAHPENDLDEIFSKEDRVAAYQYRMRDALGSIGGNHPNSGASTSYSGALMENVSSLGAANMFGYSNSWKDAIDQANEWTTTGDKPRLDITNFSYHHALLALLDRDTVYMSVRLTQEKIKQEFGEDALSRGIFPTEMCFSTRLIPVFKDLGIDWSIVSGEKIARACPDFPVIIGSGGVATDPPNKADQINPNGVDFIRTTISRGCSPVNANPLSFQPAYAKSVDPNTGEEHRMIVVPADQGNGWNDGYQCIDASFLETISAKNNPAQPSLVLLAHDGDNAFGGGYTYYNECVNGLADSTTANGGEVTSIEQYLNDFSPDPDNVIHVEDGGWAYADGDFGSPIYINWNYPLLDASGQADPVNGWHEKVRELAIFTQTVNHLLTAQDLTPGYTPNYNKIMNPDSTTSAIDRGWHYYLGALDSGNVYFGTVLDLEVKGTLGCNEAFERIDPIISTIDGVTTVDSTPPTIFLPQRFPYNPGALNHGNQYTPREFIDDGDFHIYTFVGDVSDTTAVVKYRIDSDGTNPLSSNQNETFAGGSEVGDWVTLPMQGRDFPKGNPYNKPDLNYFETPEHIARHYSVEVAGLREVLIDYYVEATDAEGNVSQSPIQHVWIGDGQGATTGGGDAVTIAPDPPVRAMDLTVTYDPTGRSLNDATDVSIHYGFNAWDVVVAPDPSMSNNGDGTYSYTLSVPVDANEVDIVFNGTVGGNKVWDNNGGLDWRYQTTGDIVDPTPTVVATATPVPTATVIPTASPIPTATAVPTATPGGNPFLMDGVIDETACEVEEAGLYTEVRDGWLYIATTRLSQNDAFIYVSGDPSGLQAANWAKSGQVGRWDYFLASENTNDFGGWFDAAADPAEDTASYVSIKSNGVLEGAIRLSELSGEPQIALGLFGNDDGGALVDQVPAGNGDSNLDGSEFLDASRACDGDFWIFVSAPEDGASVSGSFEVVAQVESPNDVDRVEFYVDGVLADTQTVPTQPARRATSRGGASGGGKTITIDGVNTGNEWTEAEIVASAPVFNNANVSNDVWSTHETQLDYTALYATWDDSNLYVAFQIADVIDVEDPANAGSSAGTKPYQIDVPQFLAIDVFDGGYGTEPGGDMWGKGHGFAGDNLPDFQVYFASNFFQGPFLTPWNGAWDPDTNAFGPPGQIYRDFAGLDGASANHYAGGPIVGPDGKDYIAETSHDTNRNSFFELAIPLELIGHPDLNNQAIGLFVSHGDGIGSGVDSIPTDLASTDLPGSSPSNSPEEWTDYDTYSVPFAMVGNGEISGTPVPTTVPTVTATPTPSPTVPPVSDSFVYTTTLNASDYSDGAHTLRAVVVDSQSNSTEDTVTFFVSAIPTATPTATIPPTTVPPTATPIDPGLLDSDRDGLTDATEGVLKTNPTDKDTDGDGFEDGVEVAIGTDPLDPNNPADRTDVDGDGVPDAFDNNSNSNDSDDDGYADFYEIALGFDPDDGNSFPPFGDANESGGRLDFVDAVVIFNIFLRNFDAEDYALPQYLDLNRDGSVDFVDGVIAFNFFLGNIPVIPTD